MTVSVIIPTYNRADILNKTLRAYAEQLGDHQICEVLVVDDGSKDHTSSVVEEWSEHPALRLRYLKQENRGLASARNHAIREAKGDILLFGDDDIIPSPSMVANHVAWHMQNSELNVGVLGLVDWAPEMNATPFMVWSGSYGPQFNFGYFKRGMELDFRYSYFCNTSVKALFLAQHGVFDETFTQYGWEDIELSYRLCSGGYRLLYNPDAAGYHYKFETFDNTRRRIQLLNSTWPVFAKTEAGVRFFELSQAGKRASSGSIKGILKKIFKLVKAAIVPLIRPLMDTRIPLPHWVYDTVFYHYITPLSQFMDASNKRLTPQD